jgi:pimeloyl-ACP methyl ester carboxylesterase
VTDRTAAQLLATEVTDDDLAHVAGPPVGDAVGLSDGRTTDVHLAGPEDGEVVLLVAGLGQQRVAWPPEALTALHEAGYRTVCVDNRDVGRGPVTRARRSTCPVATTGGRAVRTRSNGWPPITSRCSTTSTSTGPTCSGCRWAG